MSMLILQDEMVHYEVLGRGRPLLFLHGWVGSWRYWITNMQAASITYRTYALDLWGFGDSAKAPHRYSLDQQVSLIDQFLQEMGIARIAIISHGLGAVAALLYTLRFPRTVDRLLVVGFPLGARQFNPKLYLLTPVELADWLLSRTANNDSTRAEAQKTDPRSIQTSLQNLQQINPGSLPLSLQTPCLMVYGQNDPLIEPPPADQSNTLPEHIHQIVLEGSAHFPMLDESSKFNRLMIDFLSLNSGASPRQLQLKEEWKRRVR